MGIIRAAGGLLWRDDGGARRIAVIHRPHREDWSLPKGKLEDGEGWEEAALREVREETGCEARIVSFAGVAHDLRRRSPKIVLYWNMDLAREGALDAPGEVDEVAWLLPAAALNRLDHDGDREILEEALHLRGLTVPGGAARPGRRGWARAAAAGLLVASAGALLLSLRLGSAGTGWIVVGAAAGGALAGAAAARLLAGRRD